MAGDDFAGAADHYPVDVAAHPHLAMAVGHRHGVVVGAVAHQGLRAHLTGRLLAGLKGRAGYRPHGLAVGGQALTDGLLVSAQHRLLTRPAARLEPAVHRLEVPKARQRHHEVASRPAHQALHRPLVVALARTSIPVTDQVMR